MPPNLPVLYFPDIYLHLDSAPSLKGTVIICFTVLKCNSHLRPKSGLSPRQTVIMGSPAVYRKHTYTQKITFHLTFEACASLFRSAFDSGLMSE